MPKPTPQDTSWGRDAAWYDELLSKPGTYQEEVVLPNVLRLLELKPGTRVLDLACGQGYFSRAFAAAGAQVLGIDAASSLLALAREAGGGPEYVQGNAASIPFVGDKAYARVTVILAIQNILDAAAVFAEAARVLAPEGRVLVVMNHPAFRIPKASSWGWDEEAKVQYRREDRYLSELREKIQTHPGSDPGRYTISFHRPLQYYVKALAKAGLAVTRLEEWSGHRVSQPGPRAEAENRARAEFPLFLCLEARRIEA